MIIGLHDAEKISIHTPTQGVTANMHNKILFSRTNLLNTYIPIIFPITIFLSN